MTDEVRPQEIPWLGFGTWKLSDPETCADRVRTALETGYRHVDTAQAYGNEAAVGAGLEAADVDRESVFLATKLWFDSLDRASVLSEVPRQLDRLGVDYVDLLYVHWPAETYDPAETLSAFEELYHRGVVRAVGVSNFTPDLLAEAFEHTSAPIVANQVEMHPLLDQRELRAFCADHDVRVVAYSPLIHGDVVDVPEVRAVAAKRDASAAQVTLAWLREKDVAAIPKASSPAHVRENYRSHELTLDEDDVARIDAIDRTRRISDAEFAPDW